MIIGVRINPCYKLYEIWQMKRNKKGVQEGMTVCEVLADTVSPMTSSAVCFGYGSMSREAWKSNMTGSEKAMGWESFQSTNTTSVCVNGQYNAGSSSGKQPDTLTFAKWELIHFVNVLFCTASCSSVNQSPEHHYHSIATIHKHNFPIVYCQRRWFGEQSWTVTIIYIWNYHSQSNEYEHRHTK